MRIARLCLSSRLAPCTGSYQESFLRDLVHNEGQHDVAKACSLKTDTARPQSRPSFTSLEPIRIPQGQLEGKDVADMPYGDEMWTTEFVGLAMERGEGRESEYAA